MQTNESESRRWMCVVCRSLMAATHPSVCGKLCWHWSYRRNFLALNSSQKLRLSIRHTFHCVLSNVSVAHWNVSRTSNSKPFICRHIHFRVSHQARIRFDLNFVGIIGVCVFLLFLMRFADIANGARKFTEVETFHSISLSLTLPIWVAHSVSLFIDDKVNIIMAWAAFYPERRMWQWAAERVGSTKVNHEFNQPNAFDGMQWSFSSKQASYLRAIDIMPNQTNQQFRIGHVSSNRDDL